MTEQEFMRRFSEFVKWLHSKGITEQDYFGAITTGQKDAILTLLQQRGLDRAEHDERLGATGLIQFQEERVQGLYRENPDLQGLFHTYFKLSNISLREDILIDWTPTLSDIDFAIRASQWCGILEHEKLHWKRQNAGYCWDIPFASASQAAVSIAWLEYFVSKDMWPDNWLQYYKVVPAHPNVRELIDEIKTLLGRYRTANERKEEPPNSYDDGFRVGTYAFYAFDANIFKTGVFLEAYSHAGGPDALSILEPAKRPLVYARSVSDKPNNWIPRIISGWFGSPKTRDNAFWAYAKELLAGFSVISSIVSYNQEMLAGCNTDFRAPMFDDSMYWGLEHALFCYLFKRYPQLPLREIATVPQVMPFLEKKYPQEFLSWIEQRQRIAKRFLTANDYSQNYVC